MKIKEKPSEVILKSAYECLSERGYANVTMRDIAKQSGTALSQLTYYFKTKENLFLEVIDIMMDKYLREAGEMLRGQAGAQKKLTSLTGYFGQLISNEPRLLKLLVDFTAQAMWTPSFQEKIEGMFNDFSSMIKTEIVDEADGGRDDGSSMAELIFGALFGTSVQALLKGGQQNDYEPINLTESLLFQ